VRLETSFLEARLRAPFFSARQRVDAVRLVRVRIVDAAGAVGHGEAVALDVGPDAVRDSLEACRPVLAGSDGEDRAQLIAACGRRARQTQALAAVDLALCDLAGRRAGTPVWRLLGAPDAPAIEVNATITAADPERAASGAAAARDVGFRCMKVKVGLKNDGERVAAVRSAAGPGMAIRLDANGAWSADQAIAALRALEPLGIELCEEPTSGTEAVERVSAETSIPIALDESSAEPGALDRRACDAICLKIARCGGISGLVEAASRARRTGYRIYLASTLDGPLGIAAALHAAVVIRPDLPCGLATLELFEGRGDPFSVRNGRLAVPGGPGLGDGLVDWYG
jgi:L-alanine-DL-glutamate epimerase-like enolase superfamily enzyme